jgi:hypothetical protein
MFGSKKRKEAKLQAELEAQKNKEIQARMNINRTLAAMKHQSAKFEKFKNDYIEKARNAALVGNKQTYQLAKSGLKICVAKQRFLDTMVANFEISMQINDMNQVIGEFVKGINILSEQMNGITSDVDMTKAQTAYEKALENNAGQYAALEAFLTSAANSVESISEMDGYVSDEEIDKLISNQVLDNEDSINKEIESKIADIKNKINENL